MYSLFSTIVILCLFSPFFFSSVNLFSLGWKFVFSRKPFVHLSIMFCLKFSAGMAISRDFACFFELRFFFPIQQDCSNTLQIACIYQLMTFTLTMLLTFCVFRTCNTYSMVIVLLKSKCISKCKLFSNYCVFIFYPKTKWRV